jgi:hypothetical protein
MPVFLRAFPLKDDSASVSKPRRPAERLREVRWQEDQSPRRAAYEAARAGRLRHRRVVAVDRRGAAFEARIRRVAGCRRTSNAFAAGRRAAPPAALKLLRVVLYCSLTMSREPL